MAGQNRFAERYRHMTDSQLHEVSLSGNLLPEAQEALHAELVRRGSAERMLSALEAHQGMDDPGRHAALVELFRHRACPKCKSTAEPINAAHIVQVVSILLISLRKTRLMIACRSCLRNELATATAITQFGGWWMIPFGVIWSAKALRSNRMSRLELEETTPTQALLDFVAENAGRIVLAIETDPDWTPSAWNEAPSTIKVGHALV